MKIENLTNKESSIHRLHQKLYTIKIVGKTYDFKLLYYFLQSLKVLALKIFGSKNISIITLPKKMKRLTVLRSPHIYKKSQEHFTLQTNKLVIFCFFTNENLAGSFYKTLQHVTFPGIEITLEISLPSKTEY